MGIPVSELGDRISANEFVHYAASYQLYPAIGDLIDSQTAYICAMISASHGGSSKVEDFLPDRFAGPDDEWASAINRMNQAAKRSREGEQCQ